MINKVLQGDCLKVMKTLEDNSIDSIVTDPPYDLVSIQKRFGKEGSAPAQYGKDGSFARLSGGFMGKKWDSTGIAFNPKMWAEALRVLKPGGYLLSFGGTRTYHRMACAIEDAGFEIRDCIMWIYSTGFPKSLNVFKQLKKSCTCGNMEAYEKATQQTTQSHLRPVPEADLPQTINSQDKQGEVLQSGLSEQSIPATRRTQLSSSEIWQGQPSMEGRDNDETKSRELSGGYVRQVSEGISTDGEERRLHNATQIGNGSTSEQTSNEDRSSASHRPQSKQQPDRKPCAFCKQWGTQANSTFGVGTALKPAVEPIVVARKPLSEKNVASNVLKWGTGGINIDGSRVGTEERVNKGMSSKQPDGAGTFRDDNWKPKEVENIATGRFPANLIHDGSDEVVRGFPNTKKGSDKKRNRNTIGSFGMPNDNTPEYADSGSASRFFYVAKASRAERNMGLEGFEEKPSQLNSGGIGREISVEKRLDKQGENAPTMKNVHPTVKPLKLMEYLVKLVTPPNGICLDPFLGSGTTAMACKSQGFNYLGIEQDGEYVKIAEARIKAVIVQGELF